MSTYLLIPHLISQSSNIAQAAYLIGGPPIMPSLFLGHALARALRCTVSHVGLIHHDRTLLGECGAHTKGVWYPHQLRAASLTYSNDPFRDYSSKNKHALALQPVATAHFNVSLVLEVDHLHSIEAVKSFLCTARFAGGSIVKCGTPELCLSLDHVMERAQTGFALIDRSEWLRPKEGKHQAGLLIEALGAVPTDGTAWLSAACLGYATVTPFAHRGGAREGYRHAVAEPLIGLVQYQSLRSIRATPSSMLWRMGWTHERVFLATQSSPLGEKEPML